MSHQSRGSYEPTCDPLSCQGQATSTPAMLAASSVCLSDHHKEAPMLAHERSIM